MKTGKLMVFNGSGQPLSIAEREVPALKEGEILIRNTYTTLCGSDLHTYCGKRTEKTPTVLGHEIVGKIAEIGNGHSHKDFNGADLNIGDRVTWAVFAADPQEKWIDNGMPQKSEGLFKYGHARIEGEEVFHGGLGDFSILKPHTAVFKLPEELPDPVAATINCAVSTVAGAMRLAGDVAGKTVMVTGMGLLGNIAVAMCKSGGAERIIAVDVSEERLLQAKRFGATATYLIDELGKDVSVCSADVAFEMSGAAAAAELGVNSLNIGGLAVWIGAVFKSDKVKIDAEQVIRKIITIKGLHNYNFQDMQKAVAFMKDHHQDFPFDEIVEKEFPLLQASAAFDYALAHKPLRVGVVIDQAT